MDITIKNIRVVAVSNLIILGLAGCASSPAPWTQVDDSPWGAKHEAEAQNMPSDDAVSDTFLNDPVLLADPEPIVIDEPDVVPELEMIIPVMVEELTSEEEIMAMPGTNYAVQVFAGKTTGSVDKFKTRKDLADLKTVRTDRAGSIVYVLVDVYTDRTSAKAAANDLEMKTGSKPWVRSVAGLQKIVAE